LNVKKKRATSQKRQPHDPTPQIIRAAAPKVKFKFNENYYFKKFHPLYDLSPGFEQADAQSEDAMALNYSSVRFSVALKVLISL